MSGDSIYDWGKGQGSPLTDASFHFKLFSANLSLSFDNLFHYTIDLGSYIADDGLYLYKNRRQDFPRALACRVL